jgi:hypothetical protein
LKACNLNSTFSQIFNISFFVASFHTSKKKRTLYDFNILKLTETSTQEAETGKSKVQSQPGLHSDSQVSPGHILRGKKFLRLVWGNNYWFILENFNLYLKNVCILLL